MGASINHTAMHHQQVDQKESIIIGEDSQGRLAIETPGIPSHIRPFGHFDYRKAYEETAKHKEQVNTVRQRQIGQPVQTSTV